MSDMHRYPLIGLAVLLLALAPVTPTDAKQRSLDLEIGKVFEEVNERTRDYEAEATQVQWRLEDLSEQIAVWTARFANLPEELAESDRARQRREIHARITQLAANYIVESINLVDRTADVISANIVSLGGLADKVRRSRGDAVNMAKLQAKIDANIDAGRGMLQVLHEVRRMAQRNPDMVRRFQSLKKSIASLDRRVTLDRIKLTGQQRDPVGDAQNRHLASINQAIDQLSDIYAGLMNERKALSDLRDEVAIAVDLGILDITREVAQRAVPGLSTPEGPTATSVPALVTVAGHIGELNRHILEVPAVSAASESDPSARPAVLLIDGFQNF